MKFRREDGELDVEAIEHAVDVVVLAQEICRLLLVSHVEEIDRNAKACATASFGLLREPSGALLMARGLPYDSDEGRAYAACGSRH